MQQIWRGGHCSHLKVQHSHTAIVMIPRPYAAILNRLLNNILSFQIRRLAKVMCFVDGDLINESVDVISLQEGPALDLWEYRRYRPKSMKIYGTDTER